MKTPIALLLILASASGAVAAPAPAGPAVRTVSVEGEGDARALPDQLVCALAVWRDDKDPGTARSQGASAVARVLAVLKRRGVADADVQTARAAVEAQVTYDQGKQMPVGYRASTVMTVRLRKLEIYDALITEAIEAGANELRGATFESSRYRALADEARLKAVEDARARAEALAKAAGAKLGRILTLEEHAGMRPVPMPQLTRNSGGMLGAASLAPGEIAVHINVQAVWELTD